MIEFLDIFNDLINYFKVLNKNLTVLRFIKILINKIIENGF